MKKILVSIVIGYAAYLGAAVSQNISWEGGWPFGQARAVANGTISSTDYTFLSEGGGIWILNTTDPTNPTQVGQIIANEPILRLFFQERDAKYYLYTASGKGGMLIYEITDPTNPQYKGKYDPEENIYGVFVVDTFAYLANRGDGLVVVNVSNPTNPSKIGSFDNLGERLVTDVYIAGNYAYICDFYALGYIEIIDISNPQNLSRKSYKSLGVYYPVDIFVTGNYAYLTDGPTGAGIKIVDISNSTNPQVKTTNPYMPSGGSYIDEIFVQGSYAYLVDEWFYLHIVNISNASNPQLTFQYFGEEYYGISVTGNYAYLASGKNGLGIVNISTPSSPSSLGSYNIPVAYPNKVFVEGNYAYLLHNIDHEGAGLRIIDISDPLNCQTKGFLDIKGSEEDIYVKDNYAYVGGGSYGLWVVDVSDPTYPDTIGHYDPTEGGNVYGVDVEGNYAYLANAGKGLSIVNISDPASPSGVNYLDTEGSAYDIDVSGNYAYLATSGGLLSIEITDPANPSQKDEILTSKTITKISVSGNYAYIYDDTDDKLKIINTSNPANMSKVGEYNSRGPIEDVMVQGNYVYLAAVDSAGVEVVDVSSPDDPELIGYYYYEIENIPGILAIYAGHAYSAFPYQGKIYIAYGEMGLQILRLTGVSQPPQVEVIYPNGDEVLQGGTVDSIKWSATDDMDVTSVDISYSSDGGVSWNTIATSLANTEKYDWSVPSDFYSKNCLIKVVAYDDEGNSKADQSDEVFTISGTDNDPPIVTVVNPNGGEELVGGSEYTIIWSASDNQGIDSSYIYLSVLDGIIWTLEASITTIIGDDTTYLWEVGSTTGYGNFSHADSAFIGIETYDKAGLHASDASDSYFQIVAPTAVSERQNQKTIYRVAIPQPNPFKNSTQIAFSLAKTGTTTLEIYDQIGRLVMKKQLGDLKTGQYSTTISKNELTSGLYFYRIRQGNYQSSFYKLMLLKKNN